MLTRYNDCPLHKDLQPGSNNCKKCRFFEETGQSSLPHNDDWVRCKVDTAREKAGSIIRHSAIGNNPDDIAFEIFEMLSEKKIINDKK